MSLADLDDAVGAVGSQAAGAAWHRGRDPQHTASEIGNDRDVHPAPTVLGGIVRATVADAVALSKDAIQKYEVLGVLPQRLQQVGGRDPGVGGRQPETGPLATAVA